MLRTALFATLLGAATISTAWAQVEEVIVTARRNDVDAPGAVLRRPADFLLLEVQVSNDARDEDLRRKEIYQTLGNAVAAADRQSGVELSLVRDGYVVPLTRGNLEVELDDGSRPDTSETTIRVKSAVGGKQADPAKLLADMRSFIDKVKTVGRTELEAQGDVDLSIVDPEQYRDDILAIFSSDVAKVTQGLGSGYSVVVQDIDRPVQWVRTGPLQLGLFIPYHYQVIPQHVTTVFTAPDY